MEYPSVPRWLALMGYHPWHGAQLSDTTYTPLTSRCNTLLFEQPWMAADRVSRQDIRDAIASAGAKLAQYLHTFVQPTAVEETISYPRMGDRRWQRAGNQDGFGRWPAVPLTYGRVIRAGSVVTGDPTTVTLTYSDLDGDGLVETATVTATVPSGTLPREVVVQFLSADSPLVSRDIVPRAVSISGVTATITLDAVALVRPVLYATTATLNPTVVPPTAGSPFAAQVAVFRRRVDPTGTTTTTAQATLVWETTPPPWGWAWCCTGNDDDPAGEYLATARVALRNQRAGVLAVAEALYDATSGQWQAVDFTQCRPPDRVIVRYEAGYESTPELERVVARLAAAELGRPLCACEPASRLLERWQQDLARQGGTDEVYAVPGDVDNPFGSRRGHLEAWRWVQQQQRGAGIRAG